MQNWHSTMNIGVKKSSTFFVHTHDWLFSFKISLGKIEQLWRINCYQVLMWPPIWCTKYQVKWKQKYPKFRRNWKANRINQWIKMEQKHRQLLSITFESGLCSRYRCGNCLAKQRSENVVTTNRHAKTSAINEYCCLLHKCSFHFICIFHVVCVIRMVGCCCCCLFFYFLFVIRSWCFAIVWERNTILRVWETEWSIFLYSCCLQL